VVIVHAQVRPGVAMELSAIRSLARPRSRGIRRTLLSALGMAAIILGLVAMHSTGGEHASPAAFQVTAAASDAHATHAAGSAAGTAVTTMATATAATAISATAQLCDEACMHGVMDGVMMIMTCVMLLAVVAFVVFAHRPGLYRRLMDAGARAFAARPRSPLHLLRPDLTVLSISRT